MVIRERRTRFKIILGKDLNKTAPPSSVVKEYMSSFTTDSQSFFPQTKKEELIIKQKPRFANKRKRSQTGQKFFKAGKISN